MGTAAVFVSVNSCFVLPAGRHTPKSSTSGLLSNKRPLLLLLLPLRLPLLWLLLVLHVSCAVLAGCWLKPSQPCQCLQEDPAQPRSGNKRNCCICSTEIHEKFMPAIQQGRDVTLKLQMGSSVIGFVAQQPAAIKLSGLPLMQYCCIPV
jgi:hypothetical protein